MTSTPLSGLTVLVVDDDPAIRGLYVQTLKEAGAKVASSGMASEAVELIDLHPPDVVITDLRMPQHDGIWLLHQLKARIPAVPVIVVSGYLQESGKGRLLGLGFAAVLNKPLPLSELPAAVARVAVR